MQTMSVPPARNWFTARYARTDPGVAVITDARSEDPVPLDRMDENLLLIQQQRRRHRP
jgi:hypothetical protein